MRSTNRYNPLWLHHSSDATFIPSAPIGLSARDGVPDRVSESFLRRSPDVTFDKETGELTFTAAEPSPTPPMFLQRQHDAERRALEADIARLQSEREGAA
jgi:hypothetical protein